MRSSILSVICPELLRRGIPLLRSSSRFFVGAGVDQWKHAGALEKCGDAARAVYLASYDTRPNMQNWHGAADKKINANNYRES